MNKNEKAKNILNSIALFKNKDMISGALVVISEFKLLSPEDILNYLNNLLEDDKED